MPQRPCQPACTVLLQPGSATSIGPSVVMFSFTEHDTPARFTAIDAFEMFVAFTSIESDRGPGVAGPHSFLRLANWIGPRLPPVSCPAPGCVGVAIGSLAPLPCETASN